MTHTKYPWLTTKKHEVSAISTADDQSFGMAIPHGDFYGDNSKANAERTCACVNALAGKRDPAAWVKAAERVGALADGPEFSMELAEAILDMRANE